MPRKGDKSKVDTVTHFEVRGPYLNKVCNTSQPWHLSVAYLVVVLLVLQAPLPATLYHMELHMGPNGELSAQRHAPVDFSKYGGVWTPCSGEPAFPTLI